MKYIKFSIAVIVILFVVLGMLNGVLMSISKGSGVMVEVILFLLPLVATYLLIQYSWKRIVVEAEPTETETKDKNIVQGLNKTIRSLVYDKDSSTTSVDEEKIYEQVAQDLAEGKRREGLWTKALANSNGSESQAQSLYIKYHFQALKDELQLQNEINEQVSQAKKQEKSQHLSTNYSTLAEALEASNKLYEEQQQNKNTSSNPLFTFIFFAVITIFLFKLIA